MQLVRWPSSCRLSFRSRMRRGRAAGAGPRMFDVGVAALAWHVFPASRQGRHVTRVVPACGCTGSVRVVLVPERAQARRAEQEVRGRPRAASPSQRAASTRRMCPLENSEHVAAGRRARGRSRGRRARRRRAGDSPPGQPSRKSSHPGRPRGSPRCACPRTRRSSIRRDRGSSCATPPNPASLAGARRALQRTREHQREASTSAPGAHRPATRALASPRSVSGRSVRPVCWPERLHAVSPWRAR